MRVRQLLTGSTGVVGCHLLHSLIQRPNVVRVYCLIRTRNSVAASERLDDVLAKNHLLEDLAAGHRGKITAMPYDVSSPGTLGLAESDYETLRRSVTIIVHNAWAVNFNKSLEHFEPHCRGTFDLINLALRSELKKKPDFVFISTSGAIYRAKPWPVRETPHGIEAALPGTNYALSKWTTEQICSAAAEKTGLSVRILRLHQICGDTKHGMWNVKEAWPQALAAARTIGAIPARVDIDEEHYWLPTDITGAVIADLALLDQVDSNTRSAVPSLAVFHVGNKKPVLWKATVHSALRRHGLAFETISWSEWVTRLEKEKNVQRNPPYRLINFWRSIATSRESVGADGPGFRLDITNACKISPRLAEGAIIDEALVGKFLQFWNTQPSWAGQMYPARI